MLHSAILALGHPDPQLFIDCLIYACLGLSQSKDFTLYASGPQWGGEIAGKEIERAKLGGSAAAQRDQSFCAFQKELLKRTAKTTAALRMQPASITRRRSPVCPKRRRNNRGRRKNEHGQAMCDRECLIQLQQVLRRPVQNVSVPLRDAVLR